MDLALWAILSIGFFFGFLVFSILTVIKIRKKAGLFPAILFAFLFLSFMNKSSDFQKQEAEIKAPVWENEFMDSAVLLKDRMSETIAIDKNIFFKINLRIDYTKDTNGAVIPVRALTYPEGMLAATKWRPIAIWVEKTAANQIEYNVDMGYELRLLGISFGHEYKNCQGTLLIP